MKEFIKKTWEFVETAIDNRDYPWLLKALIVLPFLIAILIIITPYIIYKKITKNLWKKY